MNLLLTKAGSQLLKPGAFPYSRGGDNFATADGAAFRWDQDRDNHDLCLFQSGQQIEIDGHAVYRVMGGARDITSRQEYAQSAG
jgi:hypothetical protein